MWKWITTSGEFRWLSSLFGRKAKPVPSVRARYDGAGSAEDNRRHYENADYLNSAAANSRSIRGKLVTRSRYEFANSCYLKGIVETVAQDTVGRGPRGQVTSADPAFSKAVEVEFARWCSQINLPTKLRTMHQAKHVDGEGIGIFFSNTPANRAVKLDIRLIETEMMATPDLWPNTRWRVDGVKYDVFGNPEFYTILHMHPGDDRGFNLWTYDEIDARNVLHMMRIDRPGQLRGVPILTPALTLAPMSRRYTLASVSAAEVAASIAAVMSTSLGPLGQPPEVEEFSTTPIERGMMMALPEGSNVTQMKAEQPTTTYEVFQRALIRELCRCVHVPLTIALGDSSDSNYASGRLEIQNYVRHIRIERDDLERFMDRIFDMWLEEAELIFGLLPMRPAGPVKCAWIWDGFEHVDPAKEATAQETRLRTNLTTYADEWAKQGADWEEKFQQIAKEKALMAELGLTIADAAPQQGGPNVASFAA